MKFKELFKENLVPDYEAIEKIPEFAALKTTPQSQKWHKEGDVFKHTQLVTENMREFINDYAIPIDSPRALVLMSAALCHDLGKATTTTFDEETKDYTTRSHGAAGARITRRLFFDEDIITRECVCYMVRRHMDLHHILDKPERIKRNLIRMSYGRVPLEDMLLMNKADSLGSVNDIETPQFLKEKFFKIEIEAENIQKSMLTAPYSFRDPLMKLRYFLSEEYIAEGSVEVEKGKQFTVYMMVGVPGAGKNWWIEHNHPELPTLCRDDIRTEIGIPGEKPQGNKKQEDNVTRIFNERLYKYCSEGQSFVINNTNVQKRYRDEFLKRILTIYDAKIVYVYCEAPDIEENYRRRDRMMPRKVIDRMWNQLDFPEPYEYDEIVYATGAVQ